MSHAVDIHIKYPGDHASLVFELAVALRAPGLFFTPEEGRCRVPAQPWVNVEGWGSVDVTPTDAAFLGHPSDDDSALAPYEYRIAIDITGVDAISRGELRERLGNLIFDHLTQLGYPLAYSEGGSDIFADYLPGRGIREFPADTSIEPEGRDQWYEPRLHADPAARWPVAGAPDQGRRQRRVTIYELAPQIHIVPHVPTDHGFWKPAPPTSTLLIQATTPAHLGSFVHQALTRSATAETTTDDSAQDWLLRIAQHTADDYSRHAVSLDLDLDLDLDAGELTATPRRPYTGDPVDHITRGLPLTEQADRSELTEHPEALGTLIRTLLDTTHHHAIDQDPTR